MAPSGIVSCKKLIDTLVCLVALNRTSHALPEAWTSYTPSQVASAVSAVFPEQDTVDWRTLALNLAGPWPLPTATSLNTVMRAYVLLDKGGVDLIPFQEFLAIPLWFENAAGPGPQTGSDTFDRLAHLRETVADIYSTADGMVDYTPFVRCFNHLLHQPV